MRNSAVCILLGTAIVLTGCGAVKLEQGSLSSKLIITTTSLPQGSVGTAYSAAIAATGGTQPYRFGASNLPGGLTIDSSTGAISGTPVAGAMGTMAVAITVTDTTQPATQTATATLNLTVNAAQAQLTVTTTS